MPSNAKEYAATLRQQAADLAEKVIMPRFRMYAFKVLEVAIQNSPVNFGALRNGWHLTIGTPSGADQKGGANVGESLQNGLGTLAQVKLGDRVWIQNNVPYARVYEDGLFVPKDPGPSKATHVPENRRDTVKGVTLIEGGFHVSAPQGMLADALQEAAKTWNDG